MRALSAVPVLLLAASAAIAAPAIPRPDLATSFGSTFGANGTVAGGGAAGRLAITWPASNRLAFGVELHADDLGTNTGHLYDPNTGEDLGSIATAHRWTFGADWLGEATLARSAKWSTEAQVSFGYGRLEDDQLGRTFDSVSGISTSIGVSGSRRLTPTNTLGVAVRYRRLSLDRGPAEARANQYASAALEWRWAATHKD